MPRALPRLVFTALLSVPSPSLAQRPTLVIHITVDQLRPDYLTRWAGELTGGLGRFLRDGAFFANGFQDHANTETAPGHAATLSGRFPYSTGISANAVGVETADAPLVSYPGTGASPFRFRGTTLADWMRARDPRTQVLSVSRKDRSAILPVGRAASNAVFWYASQVGRFTTSSWYGTELPAWVRQFNDERGVFALAGREWTLLRDASTYTEPDSVVGEPRTDNTFPHVLATDSARVVSGIANTPWMDSLILVLAWRGVRAMGLGADTSRTDLLAVSLSTTDAIGHRWGPDSRELHDQVLRADQYLGAFLDSVFALRGRDRVLVTLTADHGVTPLPEIRSRFDDNAGAFRVATATFRPAVAAARAKLRAAGLDTTAFRWEDLTLWIDRTRLGSTSFDPLPAARAFADSVRWLNGVQRVDHIADLVAADTVRDAIARRLIRMYRPGEESYPGVTALVAVTLSPLARLGQGGDVGRHGTPHDADARVPVAFLGRSFTPGRRDAKVNVVDIAPTLAEVLGLTPAERVDGRVLREIIR
jgi:predicted AlkP superfamily pyrophosphatase or phosphodiesterase